jgi:hypothetical protein
MDIAAKHGIDVTPMRRPTMAEVCDIRCEQGDQYIPEVVESVDEVCVHGVSLNEQCEECYKQSQGILVE